METNEELAAEIKALRLTVVMMLRAQTEDPAAFFQELAKLHLPVGYDCRMALGGLADMAASIAAMTPKPKPSA